MRSLKVCLLTLSLLLVVVEVCYGGLNLQLMATMTGENEGDALGGRVKGLGDINGDGCDDVAVSVEGYNDRSGRVNVYFGSSEFDNNPDMILNSHVPREYFGFCIGAGDVNGDQQNDVVIGAPGSKMHICILADHCWIPYQI